MYADRKPPEEPPCITCQVVPFDENKEALKVFMDVRHQFVSDSVGPIDINHGAVDLAMKRHGIEGKGYFDKVAFLNSWWISRIRKK